MNWPRLLSTINTNNKKTHDGLVDLSLRRFDIYQNKTKQNKQKREFSAAAAFLLVCLIENQQQFTVTIVSFLFLFVFPIFHCWFKFLIASCIYCVCIDTRRARGFRSDFPPRLYLFYKLKQKKIKRNQMKSFALRRWCWIVSCCWCAMYVCTYYARARESGAGAVSSHVTQSRNFRMMDLLLLFLALC